VLVVKGVTSIAVGIQRRSEPSSSHECLTTRDLVINTDTGPLFIRLENEDSCSYRDILVKGEV
jgi:hypothetical protein